MPINTTRATAHLHRPNDRAVKLKLAAIGETAPGSTMALPGLIEERRRMYAKRLAEVQRGLPIRNATVTCNDPYKTGDGDCFHQPPRAGSMVAFELPSRGIGA